MKLAWRYPRFLPIQKLIQIFNPKNTGRGLNQPIGTLRARRLVLDGVRIVKPSCKYHFWCLKQLKNISLWGCIKIFLKKLRSNFFFFDKIKVKIFENPIFAKLIIRNCAFFLKFEFRIFSAFILCIYCPWKLKIMNF